MKKVWKIALALMALTSGLTILAVSGAAHGTDFPVTFSGGHDTEPKDQGRPVTLISAALGIKPDVFRNAFSAVTPAPTGKPSSEETRRNKDVLMKALASYKITNERLDEVSDFYRYRREDSQLWKHRDARAHAVVNNGKVVRIEITDSGAGYTTPPKAIITGLENVELSVNLSFDKDLKKNGSIKSIVVVKTLETKK